MTTKQSIIPIPYEESLIANHVSNDRYCGLIKLYFIGFIDHNNFAEKSICTNCLATFNERVAFDKDTLRDVGVGVNLLHSYMKGEVFIGSNKK